MDLQSTTQAYRADPRVAQAANEQLSALLSRSATDQAFRQKLLAEPRAALSEFTGREVPEDVDLIFVENNADATIVLPDPIDPEAELSANELEAVAGGATPVIASVLGVIATIGYIVTD